MVKILIKITIFSALMYLLQYVLFKFTESSYLHPYLGWIIVFFWIQFLVMHVLSVNAENFFDIDKSLILLAGVSARLIIAMFAMVTAALLGVVDKSLFVINFSVVYLCYLVFEITTVLSNLRSNLK